MKARPRSVENRVSDVLNEHFARLNMKPVERIPILGRTGPDISDNEMGLIIDVKSRIEVPKALFFPIVGPFVFDTYPYLMGVRLCNLHMLWEEDLDERPSPLIDYSSKIVRDYLAHMEEWTASHAPGFGVSCIVLHRPEKPIGDSVAIIYSNRRRRLIEHARQHSTSNLSAE